MLQKGNGRFNPERAGKVDAEKYLDMCFTNIIQLPIILTQNGQQFDVNAYLRMKELLTPLLENIAVATGRIKPLRVKVDEDEYSDEQKKIRDALIAYYKANNSEIGVGAVSKADSTMRFILEGEYPTRISEMESKLKDKLDSSDKRTRETAESQLSNYKFQVILKSAVASKARRLEIYA